MNAALYVKGTLGKKVYDYLMEVTEANTVAICVDGLGTVEASDIVLSEPVISSGEIPIITLNELKQLYSAKTVDSVIVATDNELLDFVIKRLYSAGIENIAVVPSYYSESEICDDSFVWIDTDKPRLPYVEYHISFHCNLKCAGCTHFSNIIPNERFGDFDGFCNDLIRLQDLFWGIGKIRLMGGEPLLNPQLPDFIYAARAAFPDADIRVVSNGLMLRDTHSEVLKAMRDTSTYFDVSMYPPTANQIDRIAAICEANGVKLTVTPPVEEFMAMMNTDGSSDPAEAYASCPASHCSYLCDGHISVCAMPQLIDIYNDRFGLSISAGVHDVCDIYDKDLDGHKLLSMLKTPMEICKYCNHERRKFKWFVSTNPDAGEWIS